MEAGTWAAWLDDILWVFYQVLEQYVSSVAADATCHSSLGLRSIRVYGKEGMLSVFKSHTGTQLRQKLDLAADTSTASTVQILASGPSHNAVR